MKTTSAEEKVVSTSEDGSVKSDSVSKNPIKPLTLSDLKFGTKKKDIFKLFEDKGWSFVGDSTSFEKMDSSFRFCADGNALFQNHPAIQMKKEL